MRVTSILRKINSIPKNRFASVSDQYGSQFRRSAGSQRPHGSNSGRDFRFKNQYNNKHSNKKFQYSSDSKEIINRTQADKRLKGDPYMGQAPYDLDLESLKTMNWEQLIPDPLPEGEIPDGVSPVPVSELAKKKVLSLPLINSLIHNRKYEWLTPVQAQTLLPILRDESVVVKAKTGTGKTAAFAIPILQKILQHREDPKQEGKVTALIVSPTRELAQQIADEIFKITRFPSLQDIKVQSLTGGVSKEHQLRAAGLSNFASSKFSKDHASRVADIIVATPGRLRDVLDDGDVAQKFSKLRARVFDEADRILDIGFEREMDEIREIIDEVSEVDETPLLLFSATADRTMVKFARKQFGDRVKVIDTVPKDEPTANELVEQHSVACANWADLYESSSRQIMEAYEKAGAAGEHFKAVVFMPTTVMVDHYERVLKHLFGRGAPISRSIMGIHGKRSQSSRQVRADQFRKQQDAILITTDVVARGMDFPKVTHVFQLGPPPDVSSYIHRIGRTARIGNRGTSYLFYTKHVREFVEDLSRNNIQTSTSVYLSDEESKNSTVSAFEKAIDDPEDAEELMGSLMSYMTILKSKYRMDAKEFLRDMQPFVELMGLEHLNLGMQHRQAWSSSPPNKRRSGYGSSRKTRMRW